VPHIRPATSSNTSRDRSIRTEIRRQSGGLETGELLEERGTRVVVITHWQHALRPFTVVVHAGHAVATVFGITKHAILPVSDLVAIAGV